MHGNSAVSSSDVWVSVHIVARPETVFRFFSDPNRFVAWMGAHSSIVPGSGGKLVVGHASGPPAFGRILEWDENRRIVFSWGHRGGAGPVPEGSSRVIVTLEAVSEGTLVTLRHSGLPSEEVRTGHTYGWRHYLSQLSQAVCHEALSSRLATAVDTYLSAWMEPESDRRRGMLGECWAEEGLYRDNFGCFQGRLALDGHIANVQRMIPGVKLERTGPVQQTHSFARFAWRATLPDGSLLFSGEDFLQLHLDGRIGLLVGFQDAAG